MGALLFKEQISETFAKKHMKQQGLEEEEETNLSQNLTFRTPDGWQVFSLKKLFNLMKLSGKGSNTKQ